MDSQPGTAMDLRVHPLVTSVLLLIQLATSTCQTPLAFDPALQDYCSKDGFEAGCGEGQVINITTAFYGRPKGSCLGGDWGHVDCGVDVTDKLSMLCTGKASCHIPNLEGELIDPFNTCPSDLKLHLQAAYKCLTVVSDPTGACATHGELHLVAGEGWLSSTKYPALSDCFLQVKSSPGQTISLDLVDYTDFSAEDSHGIPRCVDYLVVREEGQGRTRVDGCSDYSPLRRVYDSKASDIAVQLLVDSTWGDDHPRFLLHYNVVGCPYPVLPLGSYQERRTMDTVHVACNHSDETWTLSCVGGSWQGGGNCSIQSLTTAEGGSWSNLLPLGVSILIIIGVALFICLLILLFGIYSMNRKKRRRHEEHYQVTGIPHTPPTEGKVATLKRSTTFDRTYAPMTRTVPRPNAAGEYTHIWTLSRHPVPVGTPEIPARNAVAEVDGANGSCHDSGGQGTSRENLEGNAEKRNTFTTFKPAEHIYESPKFGRKHAGEDIPFYYELDPDEQDPCSMNTVPVMCTCGMPSPGATLPLRHAPANDMSVGHSHT